MREQAENDPTVPMGVLEAVESMRRAVRTAAERAEGFADRLEARGVEMQEWEMDAERKVTA